MAEVRLEQPLAHPRPRVWRGLTDPELLSAWFMPTDLRPVPGTSFTIFAGTFPGFLGPITGEVREVGAPGRLVMVWEGEKLHTRVVWELIPDESGCRLQVTQAGFLGAPAGLRAEALLATYRELFGERLPAVLDRVAARELRRRPRSGPPRPPYRNTAAGVWNRGRRLGPASSRPTPRPGVGLVRPAVPVRSLVDPGPPPSARHPWSPGRARPDRVATPRPAGRWARTLTTGGAAALVVAAVLAAVAYQPAPPPDGPAGSSYRDGPAVALQPPGVTPPAPGTVTPTGPGGLDPTGSDGPPSGPRDEPAGWRPPTATGGGAGADRSPAGTDRLGDSRTGRESPESTSVPATTAPPEPVELTADLTSTGLPLLGGRLVTVRVSNPGTVAAETWEVAMDVGDQPVVDVTGARYRRDGSRVVLTATGPLGAGEAQEIRFQLLAPVLGLLGATDPLACTIDGRPCQ